MLHNLGAVIPDLAKNGEELAHKMKLNFKEIEKPLQKHETDKLVVTFNVEIATNRYYLTGAGIIKVCSVYT